METQEINLRYGKVLLDAQPPSQPRDTKEEKEDSVPQASVPPYPKRLVQPKQYTPKEVEFLRELKNLCVKIPLLQYIKYAPIYSKLIREECFKIPRRRKRGTLTINFVGKLFDLMLGRVISPKYLDLGSLVVDLHVNNIVVPKTLIDHGAIINDMTEETMLNFNFQGALINTIIVLQLADRSIVAPKGVIKDVMVSINSL